MLRPNVAIIAVNMKPVKRPLNESRELVWHFVYNGHCSPGERGNCDFEAP